MQGVSGSLRKMVDKELFYINLLTELTCIFVYHLLIIHGLCETTPFDLGMKR